MSREQTAESLDRLGRAVREVFVSPNESDRNMEPANVVDGLFAIARGLHAIADALHMDNLSHATCMGVRKGLFGADAESDTSILDGIHNKDLNRPAEAGDDYVN